MLTISRQQALNRWDTITEPLRMALFAQANTDFIEKTCVSEHIPEDKQADVAGIAGYVLMGFLHPEDLAAELRDELKIDIRITTAIADAINKRIFVPLRADIDKVYEPVSGVASAPMVGPKILEEIRPAVPVGARMDQAEFRIQKSESRIPIPAPQPTFPQVGWSKMPVAEIPNSKVQSPKSTTGFSAPNLQKTEMGKIEIPVPPNAGGSTPPNLPLERGGMQATSGPAPVIWESETIAKPIEKAPDFKTISDDKIATASKFVSPIIMSARPAVLELGSMKPPLPPKPPTGPRVVNYADVPREQGRQVTEMTGETQAPNPKPQAPNPKSQSTTPMMPPIPKPPMPPTPGQKI